MNKSNTEKKTENVPPMMRGMDRQMELDFDYEINSIKLDDHEELNSKMYYFDKKLKAYSKIFSSKLISNLNKYFTIIY
jgi:hypothetical protein